METIPTLRDQMRIRIRDVVVIRNGLPGGNSYFSIIDSIVDELAALVCLDADFSTPEDIPEVLWMVIQKMAVALFSTLGKESLQSVAGIVSETYRDVYKENRGTILQYVENQRRKAEKASMAIQWGIPTDWVN